MSGNGKPGGPITLWPLYNPAVSEEENTKIKAIVDQVMQIMETMPQAAGNIDRAYLQSLLVLAATLARHPAHGPVPPVVTKT